MSSKISIGAFSTLPPELRLDIWAYLLSLDSDEPPRPDKMAILCAKKAIYHEVSASLYDTIDIDISPFGLHTIPIAPRKLKVRWDLAAEHPKRPKYEHLPYRRFRLVVNSYAPKGPAELILLWQKVHALVDVSRHRHCFWALEVVFEQCGEQDWQKNEEAK